MLYFKDLNNVRISKYYIHGKKEKSKIKYLHLLLLYSTSTFIIREPKQMQYNIFQKATKISLTIVNNSNHMPQHKLKRSTLSYADC